MTNMGQTRSRFTYTILDVSYWMQAQPPRSTRYAVSATSSLKAAHEDRSAPVAAGEIGATPCRALCGGDRDSRRRLDLPGLRNGRYAQRSRAQFAGGRSRALHYARPNRG